MKTFLILLLLSVPAAAQETETNERETSLFEATIYTGVPALTITTMAWIKPLSEQESFADNLAWGFQNPPVWDNNPWYVNYVCHPIAGSEYYLVARNRNHSQLASFIYSTSLSVAWEYGIEPWIGARPSIQDLLITSTVGSVLGELRYRARRKLKMSNSDSTWNKIAIVVLDPIDSLYEALEK